MTDLDTALEALRAGKLVVVPTDTIYGVAALPEVPGAVEAVFRAKGRPDDKPLPVLAAARQDLEPVVLFDDRAQRVADRFWPGPLTLVLPRAAGFEHDLGGRDRSSLAVRVPASDVTRALLARSGPLAVTSANRSGRPAATTVVEARAALGDEVAVYVDDGPARGRESTILSLLGEPEVLRVGALEADELLSLF